MQEGLKLRVELLPKKHVCAIFDCQGIVARVPEPEGMSVSGVCYCRDSVRSEDVKH
jgi:hypothetical protein